VRCHSVACVSACATGAGVPHGRCKVGTGPTTGPTGGAAAKARSLRPEERWCLRHLLLVPVLHLRLRPVRHLLLGPVLRHLLLVPLRHLQLGPVLRHLLLVPLRHLQLGPVLHLRLVPVRHLLLVPMQQLLLVPVRHLRLVPVLSVQSLVHMRCLLLVPVRHLRLEPVRRVPALLLLLLQVLLLHRPGTCLPRSLTGHEVLGACRGQAAPGRSRPRIRGGCATMACRLLLRLLVGAQQVRRRRVSWWSWHRFQLFVVHDLVDLVVAGLLLRPGFRLALSQRLAQQVDIVLLPALAIGRLVAHGWARSEGRPCS
jgi:hypothetical protein